MISQRCPLQACVRGDWAVLSDWVPPDGMLISGSGLVWFQLLKKKAHLEAVS